MLSIKALVSKSTIWEFILKSCYCVHDLSNGNNHWCSCCADGAWRGVNIPKHLHYPKTLHKSLHLMLGRSSTLGMTSLSNDVKAMHASSMVEKLTQIRYRKMCIKINQQFQSPVFCRCKPFVTVSTESWSLCCKQKRIWYPLKGFPLIF